MRTGAAGFTLIWSTIDAGKHSAVRPLSREEARSQTRRYRRRAALASHTQTEPQVRAPTQRGRPQPTRLLLALGARLHSTQRSTEMP